VDHSGQKIAEVIMLVLDQYSIPLSKIVALVSDNASSNSKCVEFLNVALKEKCGNLAPPIESVFCFAHSIHRVVLKTMVVCEHAVSCVHSAILRLRNSPQFRGELKDIIELLNSLNDEKNQVPQIVPVLYCRTRWNSMVAMLRSMHAIRPAIESLCRKYPLRYPTVDAAVWNTVGMYFN
jgi:hypothetical protein